MKNLPYCLLMLLLLSMFAAGCESIEEEEYTEEEVEEVPEQPYVPPTTYTPPTTYVPPTVYTPPVQQVPLTVQIGAFRNADYAQRFLEKAQQELGGAEMQQTNGMYRIIVGRYNSQGEAEGTLNNVRSKGYSDAFIRPADQ